MCWRQRRRLDEKCAKQRGARLRLVPGEASRQLFSLDEPVVINGQTVIPRGADAVVKLVDAKESGKFEGRTSLTLDLMSLKVNGRMVDVNTETVTEASSSRIKRIAKLVAGTAALGTIVGAIAGGGKGAAIGLGAGRCNPPWGGGSRDSRPARENPIGIAADLRARKCGRV
jgi:hypothetical protein